MAPLGRDVEREAYEAGTILRCVNLTGVACISNARCDGVVGCAVSVMQAQSC